MPVYTFLDTYDLSGKTVIPFTVHGGSGFADTVRTIAEMEPNASVSEVGLSISRNNVSDAEQAVLSLLDELELK